MRARLGVQEAPAALWVYAAVAVVSGLVALAVSSHPALTIAFLLGGLIFVVFVLRGNRTLWVISVGSIALTLLSSPISPEPWWTIVFNVASLGCLLAPPSWRFVWRSRPNPVPPSAVLMTAGVDEGSAAESGWYVDPGRPSRMRYWHAEDQRWLGVSKTPRKLRKLWQLQQESEKVGS
jgi:hypothetical protein